MTGTNEGGLARQDIVLVDFIFSEDTGSKRRPVLVLSSAEYHHADRKPWWRRSPATPGAFCPVTI